MSVSMGSLTTTTTLGMATSASAQATASATTIGKSGTGVGAMGSLKPSAMSIPLPRPLPSNSASTITSPTTTIVADVSPCANTMLPDSLPTPLVPKTRPLPNSYWATPFLLACEYPYKPLAPRPKLDSLLRAGVRTFIDLTEPNELAHPYNLSTIISRARSVGLSAQEISTIAHHRFSIPDRQIPSSRTTLARAIALIRSCEARGVIAAVHCRGGIGRTGTVVGCWLVESGRAEDGEEALGMIGREWMTVEKRRRFPCSPETGAQWEYVRTFRKGCCYAEEAGLSATMTTGSAAVVVDGGVVGLSSSTSGATVLESKW